MILPTLASLAIVSQAAVVGPSRPSVATEVVVCDDCGVRVSAVETAVACLKTSPRGIARDEAARALGHVRWTCHPEAVSALACALRTDPDWCVREDAAESLARLGACDPEAHAALAMAAVRDPKLCVRLKARKGLRTMAGRCEGDCALCERAVVVAPGPGPGPLRRLMPSFGIMAPGVNIQIGPRRSPIVMGPPIVVESPTIVEPGGPTIVEPDLRPLPPDDAPPPLPEPTPSPSRPAVPRADSPPPPEPGPSIPAPSAPPLRRSSAKPTSPPPTSSRPSAPRPKPVTPDAGLPPLEGPAGG